MTLDLAELARLERILHQSTRVHLDVASAEETARQIQALLWEHRPALLAAARRLEELTQAAAHLEKQGGVLAFLEHGHVKPGSFTADLMPEDLIEAAERLGWKATP